MATVIRIALFGDGYIRNLVTPDMLTLIKVSAALCSEIWKILYKLGYRMNLVDLHDHQIIYDNITSIPAERM